MKKFKYFLSLLLILTAIWLSKTLLIQINTINNDSKNNNWIDFDTIKLSELVNENKIVFVDITANWCLTCFYNKKTVLDRKKVKNVFETYDVKKIRGDLTKPNREINEYINSFGRFGIPFNVIYSSSAPQGILLPEVLTVQNLLSTFESIKND
jgi:suppressor for copper-sensitivity B